MPHIALRGMPDILHRELKEAAERNHRSLNGEILARLAASVRPISVDVDQLLERVRRRHAALGPLDLSAAALRELRIAGTPVIVVDTNVMVRLVVGGEQAAGAARRLRDDSAWAAPGILISELHNVLLGFVRRGAVTSDEALAMSDDARSVLGDRIVAVPGPRVIAVALECGLSAYDAEFVVLARMLGVSLVTLDQAILDSAGDVAVSLAD